MYILGVNISHEPSACLLKDGEIVYFCEDDRLTGVKCPQGYHDDMLNNYDKTGEVVPLFHQVETLKKYTTNIDYIIFSSFGRDSDIQDDDRLIIRSIINKITSENIKFNTSLFYKENHHLYHGANAFYASGFEDAAALVMDGGGSYDDEYEEAKQYEFPFREIESIYDCSYDFPFFKPKYKHYALLDSLGDEENEDDIFWKRTPAEIYSRSNSCGNLFAAMATAFEMIEEQTGTSAGKLMGLSGHRLASDDPKENFYVYREYEKNKSIFTDDWFVEREGEWITKPNLVYELENFLDEHDIDFSLKENTLDFYICASLANKLQHETFLHTCRLINRAIKLTGKNKLVLSGGYFMNCVNNYKYTKAFPNVEFFVDPIPHDAGTAIGAAKYLWYGLTKSKEKFPFKHLYFGPEK